MKSWAFLRRFVVRDQFGDVYLWRLRVLETPWFGLYLHNIRKPDPDKHLHDHPWDFVSIVLRGEYVELHHRAGFASQVSKRRVRWFNFKRAETLHRIDHVPARGVWSLILRGRRRRPWGFLTPDGWVEWFAYIARRDVRGESPDNTWDDADRAVLQEHSCPECGGPIWLRAVKIGMACRRCSWRTTTNPERLHGLEHGWWGCGDSLNGYHCWTKHGLCAFCGEGRSE